MVAGRRGLLCILAAWFYTGGKQPYGYLGLGEVMVFVFFGLVAVLGTTYVQTERFELPALYAAIGVGAFACAILVANNLRDIPTDTRRRQAHAGRRPRRRPHPPPLRAADRRSRVVALVGVALTTTWWVAARAGRASRRSARSTWCSARRPPAPALVPVLQLTGVAELLYAAGHLRRARDQRGHRLGVSSHHPGATLRHMWFLILLAIVAVCALAYSNRVKLLAKVLGQSETRINRQLKRKPR